MSGVDFALLMVAWVWGRGLSYTSSTFVISEFRRPILMTLLFAFSSLIFCLRMAINLFGTSVSLVKLTNASFTFSYFAYLMSCFTVSADSMSSA